MNRVLRVARVLLTTWKQTFGWPVAILALSFVFNLAFYASMGDEIQGERITGGLVSIYVFQIIMCSQTMLQTFSFAVGLNVSRRTFFAASTVVLAFQSLLYAVLLYGLAVAEQLTDGWGYRIVYFTLMPVTDTYSPLSIVVFLVPMLVVSFLGMFLGIVAKRWGTNGVLGVVTLTVVVLGTAGVLVTLTEGWTAVFTWLGDQPGLALAAGWTLLPLAVLAAGSFGLTRRAIP